LEGAETGDSVTRNSESAGSMVRFAHRRKSPRLGLGRKIEHEREDGWELSRLVSPGKKFLGVSGNRHGKKAGSIERAHL